jgi:hypothetical protein
LGQWKSEAGFSHLDQKPANSGSDSISILLPVIAGVGQAFVHYGIEAGVLLDEDLAELAILAEQDGL